MKAIRIKQNKIEIIKKRKVSVNKINKLLERLEKHIEKFVNKAGLDSAIDFPDWVIAEMCVNVLRKELIVRQKEYERLLKEVKGE